MDVLEAGTKAMKGLVGGLDAWYRELDKTVGDVASITRSGKTKKSSK